MSVISEDELLFDQWDLPRDTRDDDLPLRATAGTRHIANAIRKPLTESKKMADTKMKRGRPKKPVEIPLSRQRSALLQAAGFTQDTLADRIEEQDGVRVSRQTVQAVLAGDFRNDDVIRHFCEVTGTKPKTMFPVEQAAS